MSRLEIHLPAISQGQISNDLCWLTEQCEKVGAELSGGFLGGEYGYGAFIDNDVFMMHPFCWCEREDCPWCWGCVCPEEADIYIVNDQRVTFDEWLDAGYKSDRTSEKDTDLMCDYCTGERTSAPNFRHKATGAEVSWYKYIGRSMDIDLHGADWRTVLQDCVRSLESAVEV